MRGNLMIEDGFQRGDGKGSRKFYTAKKDDERFRTGYLLSLLHQLGNLALNCLAVETWR